MSLTLRKYGFNVSRRIGSYFRSRSSDPDVALRERTIRIVTTLLLPFMLLAIFTSLVVFKDPLKPISQASIFLTFSVFLFAARMTLNQRRVYLAGVLMMIGVMVTISGFIVLQSYEGPLALPTILLSLLIGAIALPRRMLWPFAGMEWGFLTIVGFAAVPSVPTISIFGWSVRMIMVGIPELLVLQLVDFEFESRLDLLRKANDRVEYASRAKTQFLENMSHELRTPLGIIKVYTGTMLSNSPELYEEPLPTRQRNQMIIINDNVEYVLSLVNDVLDLGKIEAGKLEIHPEWVDLYDTLKGIISTSIGLVKDKPIQIRSDFSADLPSIWADPIRVRQILLNLMSNALKFTAAGSVSLQARIEGDKVSIAVIDTGIGIPEVAVKQIFDRFQQAEYDTGKRYGGTGLGLNISYRLAQMHGGDLTVQSTLGQGSAFRLILPLEIKHIEATMDLRPADAEAKKIQMPTSTLVLVEPDSRRREICHRWLGDHSIVDVTTIDDAIDTVSGLVPDLVVMGGQDETDRVHLVAALGKHPETTRIPIIFFSTGNRKPDNNSVDNSVFFCTFDEDALRGEIRKAIQPQPTTN